jgi:hypothetical protein
MARHLVVVRDHTDALDNAAAIRQAREAASTPTAVAERREAIAEALARVQAGERLTKILEDVALGQYLTGYLEASGSGVREQLAQAELANKVLTEENRRLVRRQPTPRARA